MMKSALCMAISGVVGFFAATSASAEGFAIRDLTKAPDMVPVLGAGFLARAEPDRVTLFCFECAGAPMIDILMGRQTDGTEDRLRSGETTVADMEALCQRNDPDCTVTGVDAGPAVGFVSRYVALGKPGNTVVIMRGGDLLTVRSIADDPAVAAANADVLIRELVPLIVGN